MKRCIHLMLLVLLFSAATLLPARSVSAAANLPADLLPQARSTMLPIATESALLYASADSSRRIGTIKRDAVLPINARSEDNKWLRTSTGAWISADSVDYMTVLWQVSESSYSRATAAEFNYLKQIVRWQLSLLDAAANFDPENPDTLVDLLSDIDEMEQWSQSTKAPSGIADMGEWIGAVSMICSSAASVMSNAELWSGCTKAMTVGYIPEKFQTGRAGLLLTPTAAPTAAAMPTTTPAAKGQGSVGQQVLDLFNRAGLEISGAAKTAVDPSDVLPDTYAERWEFVIAEVAPKGGQIFVCETKANCDVLFDYYSALSALAGPNLFQSPNGLVVAQLNSGLSPETAAKFETIINSLE